MFLLDLFLLLREKKKIIKANALLEFIKRINQSNSINYQVCAVEIRSFSPKEGKIIS